MDNMKYFSGSLAHDFDMFMPKVREEEKSRDNIITLPVTKSSQQKRAGTSHAVSALSGKAFSIAATLFIVFSICASIYMRAEITSVNSKINDIRDEINVLDSENTRLSVELERKISFSNIDVEAEKLGMQKTQRSQIVYIKTNEENLQSQSEPLEASVE